MMTVPSWRAAATIASHPEGLAEVGIGAESLGALGRPHAARSADPAPAAGPIRSRRRLMARSARMARTLDSEKVSSMLKGHSDLAKICASVVERGEGSAPVLFRRRQRFIARRLKRGPRAEILECSGDWPVAYDLVDGNRPLDLPQSHHLVDGALQRLAGEPARDRHNPLLQVFRVCHHAELSLLFVVASLSIADFEILQEREIVGVAHEPETADVASEERAQLLRALFDRLLRRDDHLARFPARIQLGGVSNQVPALLLQLRREGGGGLYGVDLAVQERVDVGAVASIGEDRVLDPGDVSFRVDAGLAK